VILSRPGLSERVSVRIVHVPTTRVHVDVTVSGGGPPEHSDKLSGVALVDEDVDLASLTLGDVCLQLMDCILLIHASLKKAVTFIIHRFIDLISRDVARIFRLGGLILAEV